MKCKYYDKHLETISEYIGCLYELEGCCTGGMLHILLDDDNLDDDDIAYRLRECLLRPEREEAKIGQLICEEYLKLGMEQRRLLCSEYIGNWLCSRRGDCENCYVHTGREDEI